MWNEDYARSFQSLGRIFRLLRLCQIVVIDIVDHRKVSTLRPTPVPSSVFIKVTSWAVLVSLPVVRVPQPSTCAHVPHSNSRARRSYLAYFFHPCRVPKCCTLSRIYVFFVDGGRDPSAFARGAGHGGSTKIARLLVPSFLHLPPVFNSTSSPVAHFYFTRSFPTTDLSPTFADSECESNP